MAKSGENFITLDTVKEHGIDPLAYRLFCFSAHYRSPLMFSWEGLLSAEQGLHHLKKLIESEIRAPSGGVAIRQEVLDRILMPFWEAVCDDLNMPVAVAEIWNLLRGGNATPEEKFRAIEEIEKITALDLLKREATPQVVQEIVFGSSCVRAAASSCGGVLLAK